MTKKLSRGWKVISNIRRISIVIEARSPNLGVVVYEKNKKTYPAFNCGPLCVFESNHAAWAFTKTFILPEFIIVPCTYKPSKRIEVNYINAHNCICRAHICSLPTGTILADFVTCKE